MNRLEFVTTRNIQEKILPILKSVHMLCEMHAIEYFIIGGTLIGATRHSGFIPWDDDIDIGLTRENYEKLLKVAHELPYPLKLLTNKNDKSYIYPFAKCYDTSTTVTEKLFKPFTRGVWIDIFPIDATYDNKVLRTVHLTLIQALRALLIINTGAFRLDNHSSAEIKLRVILHHIIRAIPSSYICKALNKTLTINQGADKLYIGNLLGRWGKREITNAVNFKARKIFKFENLHFFGPSGHDAYLRKIYGNYNTLPPIEKQRSDHHSLYINLETPYGTSKL